MTKIRDGYKETEIGVIPEDWEVKNLNDIVDFYNGKAHENDVKESGKYKIINSKFVSTEGSVVKYTDSCMFPLVKDDIVIVMSDVPNGKAIAKTFLIDENDKYTLNQRIGCFRNIQGNVVFLNYLINRNKYYLRFDDGAKQTNLRKDEVLGLKVQFPPLPEQQRIAEILSTTDSHIEKLDKTIEDYQLFKKGMMKKLLTEGIGHTEFKETEIGRIPRTWDVVKLSEIASLITKGTTPSTYGFNFTESGVNFIKVENIFPSGFIDIDSTPKISDECNAKLSRSIILESDILVSIAGTIGRSAIVDKTHLPANTNQALAIIRLKDTLKTDVKYINYTFSSSYFMSYISSIKTVGAQPNMSLKQLNDNLIALPDVEEQRKISSVLNELDNRIRQYEYLRSDFANLKASLMTTLLTGKKRVIIEGEKI